ncbi:hypothetical protein BJ742DRAFT_748034 [Cladochytrium replicatum]|nr:hypothetical protein BJ742DRAFT_748034 [Cladochytrium replicatum]
MRESMGCHVLLSGLHADWVLASIQFCTSNTRRVKRGLELCCWHAKENNIYRRSGNFGQITLSAVLVEAVVVIVLEAIVMAVFLKNYDGFGGSQGENKGFPTYCGIFIVSQVFQIALSWDAVWHQNTIQIIGFVLFNFCVCAYSVFQYANMNVLSENLANNPDRKSLTSTLIAIPVIVGAFGLFYCYLAFRLYLEFGWKVYKKIGADPNMRNMYRMYQVFLMLLKLDVFFFLGFGVQFISLVIDPTDPEYALTIAALPITVGILFLAVYGVRREDKWIMCLFVFGLLLAMVYFIFKITRMFQPEQALKYRYTRNHLTFFATLSLVVVTLTIINAIVSLRNFGKGLKQHSEFVCCISDHTYFLIFL